MIAENKEKYITFSVDVVFGKYKDEKTGKEKERKIKLKFIDRVRFMVKNLDDLSSNLEDEECESLR